MFWLIMTISAILIVVGSYLASSVAEALQYHYSDALIAAFIALIQTLPEYVFVVILTLNGHYDYAIMSIIGANILLIALGFSSVIFVAYFAGTKEIRSDKTLDLMRENCLEAIFLAISGAYLIYLGIKGYLDLIDAVILIAIFLIYTIIVTRLPPEVEEEEPSGLAKYFADHKRIAIIAIIIGAIIIWFSAEEFTEGIIHYAKDIVTGIFLVAIIMPLVSEFPEKLTAYIAALRNEDMARLGVANFMSTRINNGTLLFGTMMLVTFISSDFQITSLPLVSAEFPLVSRLLVMAGLLSIVGALTTIDRKITLFEAIVLFGIFVILTFVLFNVELHAEYLVYADLLMLILGIFIIANAIVHKRFYWWGDLKETIRLMRKKSE